MRRDPTTLTIVRAQPGHAAAIGEIYDEAIAGGDATFATGPHPEEERRAWLAARSERAPVFAALDGGRVVGWSALAPFSHRPWYDGVAEYTVYVAGHRRGQGLGRVMLEHLLGEAPAFGYWKLVGMILAENAAGLGLAVGLGFRVVGTHRGHAHTGDRWRDVVLIERHLELPPV